jgi:hypothetical protein
MRFFDAVTLFGCVVMMITSTATIVFLKNKGLRKSQRYKYCAIACTTAGVLLMIALYNLLLCIGVCFILSGFCAAMYARLGRAIQLHSRLDFKPQPARLSEAQQVVAYLLPESDPRPLPSVRRIN